jgi:hypothetical protein
MTEDSDRAPVPRESDPLHPLSPEDELPVVARLIVEIRSDGTRTIARGALAERTTGEKVALEAHGTTPLALAKSLMRELAGSLVRLPFSSGRAVKKLLARESDEPK